METTNYQLNHHTRKLKIVADAKIQHLHVAVNLANCYILTETLDKPPLIARLINVNSGPKQY